jgi:hypothetical protein
MEAITYGELLDAGDRAVMPTWARSYEGSQARLFQRFPISLRCLPPGNEAQRSVTSEAASAFVATSLT